MTKRVVLGWSLCLLSLAWTLDTRGATIVVPSDQPTIQRAVDAAGPGDTIQVLPGSYQESVRVRGAKTGLTIEAAEATDPPTIHGTPNKSADGIRVDSVDGVTVRYLRILGAYDGVRLNHVQNAVLAGLDIEDSALGIRVNHGQDTIVEQCVVLGTRVEQGIFVAFAPRTVIRDSTIGDTAREGIGVANSPGVVLGDDQVTDSRTADGIAIGGSPGASIDGCTASDSYHDGIHITNSAGLVLSSNLATDNLNIGLSLAQCPPFQTVADVTANANSASGNGQGQIVVGDESGGTSTTIAGGTTTSSTATSTTTPGSTTTTSSLPGAQAQWRFYVRITLGSGEALNVNVPLRSEDAPLAVALPPGVLAAFPVGGQTAETEIAALGGHTLQQLTGAASAYMVSHPADYPDFVGILALRWAMRVTS